MLVTQKYLPDWQKLNHICLSCEHFINIWRRFTAGDFPGGSDSKESAGIAGDPGSIPVWGRSPGEGSGNPLQYSCLENSMERGTWWAIVHGGAKSWTRWSDWHFHFFTLMAPVCKAFAAPHMYDNSVFLGKYWKTYSDKPGRQCYRIYVIKSFIAYTLFIWSLFSMTS